MKKPRLNNILVRLFIALGKRWFNEIETEANDNGVILEIVFRRVPF